MNAGQLLLAFSGIIGVFENVGVLKADGTFTTPTTEQYGDLAAGVEKVLKSHGLDVPERVDTIIRFLPLLLELAS